MTASPDVASTLTVPGDLDIRSGPALLTAIEAALTGSSAGTLFLDLTAVGLVDAAGITALLAAHRLAEAAGTTLRLVGVRPRVVFVLDLTGASEVLSTQALAA